MKFLWLSRLFSCDIASSTPLLLYGMRVAQSVNKVRRVKCIEGETPVAEISRNQFKFQSKMTETRTSPIPVLTDVTAEEFREKLQPARRPCVLRGLELGTCVERWKDPEYLKSKFRKEQGKVNKDYYFDLLPVAEDWSKLNEFEVRIM